MTEFERKVRENRTNPHLRAVNRKLAHGMFPAKPTGGVAQLYEIDEFPRTAATEAAKRHSK